MSKGDKRQRQKRKREAKRHEARRLESISPLRRLAEAPGEIECWMSKDFEDLGQAEIFVYKRAAGLSGIACFLVDRGVVGLKDAWTRMGVTRMEFDDVLKRASQGAISIARVGVDDVRRRVAGGMRWAHENGMRLPKDWAKTASLMGGVGDWMSADVSAFVKEFAGHPEDLRQRLVNEPFEAYVRRRDVQFEFSEDAPYMNQATGQYADAIINDLDEEELEAIVAELPTEQVNAIAQRFTPAATALAGETATWLATRNDRPSVGLTEAWRSIMLAALLAKAAMPDAPDEERADFSGELLKDLSGRIQGSAAGEHDEAIDQALEHLETDPAMIQKAILKCGLADDMGEGAGEG